MLVFSKDNLRAMFGINITVSKQKKGKASFYPPLNSETTEQDLHALHRARYLLPDNLSGIKRKIFHMI